MAVTEITADYCIAGGGIAGLLVASRLAATGKRIALLEQGPRYSEQDRVDRLIESQQTLRDGADYNDDLDAAARTPHTTADPKDGAVDWSVGRLFGLGGTALHWEGESTRPRAEDLRVKTLYGYSRDWPITYSELEPWLFRAEHELGVAGAGDNPYTSPRSGPFPMPAHPFSYFDREFFRPGLERLGMVGHSLPHAVNSVPFRNRSTCRACRICVFCPTGARYSPDRVLGPVLDASPNVTIVHDVSLRRLETSAGGERIVAAHAVDVRERTPVVVRAKGFVVAMGGVGTPRALLLSADEGTHRHGLGNMGGQLGRGFCGHAGPSFNLVFDRRVGGRLGFTTMGTDHFLEHVDRRKQPPFMVAAAPSLDPVTIGHRALEHALRNDTISLDAVRAGVTRMATLWTLGELEPSGTLELDADHLDDFGSPVAKITKKWTARDREGFALQTQFVTRLADSMGATFEPESEPVPVRRRDNHPSGTTAMATSPDEGVCDSNLKVFGLENLHLASSSVFPHLAAPPPTLTIAALSLRLAAHLSGEAL